MAGASGQGRRAAHQRMGFRDRLRPEAQAGDQRPPHRAERPTGRSRRHRPRHHRAQASRTEMLEISNREQRRIGHDLHDGVCQQLAGISLLAETSGRPAPGKGRPRIRPRSSGSTSSSTPPSPRPAASPAASSRCASRKTASSRPSKNWPLNAGGLFQITAAFPASHPPQTVDNTIALHLYYIAQEAIVNAAKHGQARNVRLSLRPADDRYALAVEDDGRGFTPLGNHHPGMGLRIMHYRARVIGATLEVTSRPGAARPSRASSRRSSASLRPNLRASGLSQCCLSLGRGLG